MQTAHIASSEYCSGRFPQKKVVGISRKDTIIVAVLVNIALIAILFAFSDKEAPLTSSPEVSIASSQNVLQKEPEIKPIVLEKSFDQNNPVDEIDQILQEFASQTPSVSSQVSTVKEAPKRAHTSNDSVKPGKNTFEIKVKKGDSIAKIAKTYGVTIEDILTCNNLPNEKLKIGQSLQIPRKQVQSTNSKSKLVAVSQPVQSAVKDASGAEYYVIRSGDNPWKIARKFGLKFEDLLKLNGLDEESAKNLKVGQRIRIK